MSNIRIEELSIGDWVRDSNGIIAKVRGIENWDDGYILNVQTVSGSVCALSATGALPIPLTPEILEKNGFVQESEVGYERFEWRENGSVAITLNRDSFSKSETFVLTTFKIGINGWLLRIEHVHELQHAMRLAGIEKEIEV